MAAYTAYTHTHSGHTFPEAMLSGPVHSSGITSALITKAEINKEPEISEDFVVDHDKDRS